MIPFDAPQRMARMQDNRIDHSMGSTFFVMYRQVEVPRDHEEVGRRGDNDQWGDLEQYVDEVVDAEELG